MIQYLIFFLSFILFYLPDKLHAIQAHGGSEGIVVHQLSHLFFLFSLIALIYWLKTSRIFLKKGWGCIMLFAFFMALWNLDVILMHFLDEQSFLILTSRKSLFHIEIKSLNNSSFLIFLYYFGKLDHLFCVPALYFLYRGLKEIRRSFRENP